MCIIFLLKYGLIDHKIYCNAYYCQQTHTKQNHHFKAKIKFDIKLDQAALIRFVTWNELIAFIINFKKMYFILRPVIPLHMFLSANGWSCSWVIMSIGHMFTSNTSWSVCNDLIFLFCYKVLYLFCRAKRTK